MLARKGPLTGVICLAVAGGCADRSETLAEREQAVETPTCITVQRGTGGQVADTFIKANLSRWNFGWVPYLISSEKEESLVRFDLSWLPPGAAISKATLKLYVAGAFGQGKTEFRRALVPWNEHTVTFASFRQRFSSEIAAEARLDSPNAQKSIDLTTLVKSWTSGTPNYGVVIRPGRDHHPRCNRWEDDDADPTIFVGSENPHVSRRPALEVCYTLPVTDHCAANPCQNDGVCNNTSTGYTCTCAAGYDGTNCENNINDCASNPCQNGGSCTDGVGGYTCTCPAGYDGANCQTNIDDCSPNPCENGGTCTDGVASHTCHCEPGYDGANCEHLIDNCESQPCHNGGTCTNDVNGYTCACAAGYTGPTCDTNIDDCASNPCQNGGTCLDGVNSFTCSCAPGYTGATCETNIDDCAGNPCLNGGTCTDGVDSFTCACAAGYSGTNCEIDIDECNPNPCQNGGSCLDGVNSFSCTCPAGYVGPLCEFDACTQISCDDNNACTADGCAQGVCQHAAISCDDSNPCTLDRCDAATGCAHDPVSCDDSNACTADSCGPNGCEHSGVSCDDGNQCTADSCDPIAGCLHNAISCDDGNACSVDACDPTQGCVHSQLSCDDNNACTTDTCGSQGCEHATITCNDGHACTTDSCDPAVGCVASNPEPGCQECSSNNQCTVSGVCVDGRCCQGDLAVGGTVTNPGPNISFCATDADHLEVEVRVGAGALSGTITAPNGATIPFSGNASKSVEIPSTVTGVYHITVSPAPTQVSVKRVPPDMTVDAGPGNGNQTVTLTSLFQHGRFTFNESAGGRVFITGPAIAANAKLIAPSGAVVRQDFLFNLVNIALPLANESGTYVLDVAPNVVPQTITLGVVDVPPDPTITFPIGGGVQTAQIAVGQAAHFKFTSIGNLNQAVDVVFSMPVGALASLVAPNGQTQFFATSSGYRRVVLTQPGDYRLDVGGLPGLVSVNVFIDPEDAEIPVAYAGPPSSYAVAAYQNANVRFTVPAGDAFMFSHQGGICQNLQLFGPPNGALVTVVPGCTPTTRPLYTPDGGQYTFRELEDAVALNPTLGASRVDQIDGNTAGIPVFIDGANGTTTNAAVAFRGLPSGKLVTVTASATTITTGTTFVLFDDNGTVVAQGTGATLFTGIVNTSRPNGTAMLVVTTTSNNRITVAATITP